MHPKASRQSDISTDIPLSQSFDAENITPFKHISYHPLQRFPAGSTKFTEAEKVASLQNDISVLRREGSLREQNFQQERSCYLSRIEIMTMEINQLKTQKQNAAQLNQTLTQALKNKQSNTEWNQKIESSRIEQRKQEVAGAAHKIRELEVKNDMLEREATKTSRDHDHQIATLTTLHLEASSQQNRKISDMQIQHEKKIGEMERQHFSQMEVEIKKGREAVKAVSEMSLPKETMNMVIELLCRKLQIEDEKRPALDVSHWEDRENEWRGEERKSHKKVISLSKSVMSNAPSQSKKEKHTPTISRQIGTLTTQSSLLCEVCQRVYQQNDFLAHLSSCQEPIWSQTPRHEHSQVNPSNSKHSISRASARQTKEGWTKRKCSDKDQEELSKILRVLNEAADGETKQNHYL